MSKHYCSFCAKTQAQVADLIKGPGDIGICNECTSLAAEIVREKAEERAASIKQSEKTMSSEDEKLRTRCLELALAEDRGLNPQARLEQAEAYYQFIKGKPGDRADEVQAS